MKRRVIIEEFGKIGHAELEMKPMMMFVGDNNSGKSYLMSLLWGLSSVGIPILTRVNDEIKKSKLYKECEQYVIERIMKGEGEEPLSYEWFERFWHLLNDCIKQNKDHFVSEIFNKNMHIGKLELEIEGEAELKIEVETNFYYEHPKELKKEGIAPNNAENKRILWISDTPKTESGINILDDYMQNGERYIEFILEVFFGHWINFKNKIMYRRKDSKVFLPSSRTGFILSKNLLTNNIYENSFNRFNSMIQEDMQEDQDSYFTKPVISFLKLLNNIGEKKYGIHQLEELAEFMERTILHGQVEIQNAMAKSFLYKPETLNNPIQMYLASAVVTEITPLYLLCKYRYGMTDIFIEEPEMCMHPRLQTRIARVLVRLCNMEIPVIMTTHSDIIIQHINNMLRVKNSDKKQELMGRYKIEEQDLLGKEQVGVYQFSCLGNDRSQIVELKAGEMGFETTTFSDAFEEMLELTYAI